MKTIAIANQKGGVGKTTTAVTLAHGLALKGKQVLLIDLDPQGQCATALDIAHEDGVYTWLVAQRPLVEVARKARTNLALVPGDKKTATLQMLWQLEKTPIDALAHVLKPLGKRGKLDYVIFDTSPSGGGLQERALWAADLVIIPVKVDYLSADAVRETVATMQHNIELGWRGSLLGILPTFLDSRVKDNLRMLQALEDVYTGQVLDPIHDRKQLPECVAEGRTIWEYDGGSVTGQEYSRLLYRVMAE